MAIPHRRAEMLAVSCRAAGMKYGNSPMSSFGANLQVAYETERALQAEAWAALYGNAWTDLSADEMLAFRVALFLSGYKNARKSMNDCVSEFGISDDWKRWVAGVFGNLPKSVNDLAKWPDALPQPPEEPDGLWHQARKAVKDQDNDLRRIVGGYVLGMLSFARTIRNTRSRQAAAN